jgi:hypothetical protein
MQQVSAVRITGFEVRCGFYSRYFFTPHHQARCVTKNAMPTSEAIAVSLQRICPA